MWLTNNKSNYSFVSKIDSSFTVSAAKRRIPSANRSVAIVSSTLHSLIPFPPFSIQRKVLSSISKYSRSDGHDSSDSGANGSYTSLSSRILTSSVESINCCSRFGAIVSLSHPASPKISSTERNDAPITTVLIPFFLKYP